jgi:hypothetical protein
MWRLYANAKKCYVYLSDVSTSSRSEKWKVQFQMSRWFTRCWTLQELLAPKTVEFLSRDGQFLGNKRTLEREIHEITSIPIPALRGAPASEFTIEEKLSWATGRHARRPEDKAYSLLGLFDVVMPLFYGEGDNARRRLREQIERAYGYRIPDRIQEDNNGDTASIHSVDSISPTLTGSSITLFGEVQAAADEFVVALLEDQNVKPLLAAAFDRMAADRLQRNIKRLLKVYASNLQAEAKGEVEKKAADLVLGRARYISYRTCQQYDKSVPSKAGNFEQLKFRDSERRDLLESYLQSMMSQTTDDAGDDDDERQYSDVSSEDETDQPDLSDLARVKSFFLILWHIAHPSKTYKILFSLRRSPRNGTLNLPNH